MKSPKQLTTGPSFDAQTGVEYCRGLKGSLLTQCRKAWLQEWDVPQGTQSTLVSGAGDCTHTSLVWVKEGPLRFFLEYPLGYLLARGNHTHRLRGYDCP